MPKETRAVIYYFFFQQLKLKYYNKQKLAITLRNSFLSYCSHLDMLYCRIFWLGCFSIKFFGLNFVSVLPSNFAAAPESLIFQNRRILNKVNELVLAQNNRILDQLIVKRSQLIYFFLYLLAKTSKRQLMVNTNFWFLRFIAQYLQCFSLNTLHFAFTPLTIKFQNRLASQLSFLVKKRYFQRLVSASQSMLFEFIFLILYARSIQSFTRWFSSWIELIHFKQHKQYFIIINTFLRDLFKFARKYSLLQGYTLFFKGKLARGGSVRKKYLFFRRGAYSSTKKSLRFNFQKFLIRTATGVVGGQLSIYF